MKSCSKMSPFAMLSLIRSTSNGRLRIFLPLDRCMRVNVTVRRYESRIHGHPHILLNKGRLTTKPYAIEIAGGMRSDYISRRDVFVKRCQANNAPSHPFAFSASDYDSSSLPSTTSLSLPSVQPAAACTRSANTAVPVAVRNKPFKAT